MALLEALSTFITSVTALLVAATALWHAFHHTHGPGQ